jgi:hypothetical protein
MTTLAVLWTAVSRNEKTGPMPVTTTASPSCPAACPLNGGGCYAQQGPLGHLWNAISSVSAGEIAERKSGNLQTIGWGKLVENVATLPAGQIWRHNQAGDLPHVGQQIDATAVCSLVDANAKAGARGFTYTHHDPAIGSNLETIRQANVSGFTVNLSANNLEHADKLAELEAGPVVTLLPASVSGNTKIETAAGRRVVVCPATYRDDVTCLSCGLCAKADRSVIVGFPAHGAAKAKASKIAA